MGVVSFLMGVVLFICVLLVGMVYVLELIFKQLVPMQKSKKGWKRG